MAVLLHHISQITRFPVIIFDLGGVIINLDFDLTRKGIEQLGQLTYNQVFEHPNKTRLFNQYETGSISTAEFRNQLRSIIHSTCSDAELDRVWNAMLLDIPPQRIELLYHLRQSHRLFLLSNTNQMHQHFFEAYLMAQYGKNVFTEVFEKVYYSHLLGLRKPNTDIFDAVISDAGINPADAVFIDDYLPNVEGAIQAGLNGYYLQPSESILDINRP